MKLSGWLSLGAGLAMLSACGPAGRQDAPADGSVNDKPDADDGIDAAPFPTISRVYAHSGGTLYQLDSDTLVATPIGAMSGLGTQSLTDLAIDKNDAMVGITFNKLVKVDATTGNTTLIKDLSMSARGLTSLSFVPEDLGNPNSADILVSANDDGVVFEIDAVTGNATELGNFGSTSDGPVVSSGDLIGVRGFGIYATVNVGDDAMDYLARIDPANNWKATPIGAGTGFDNIFGLAYWNGKIYGFVDGGFMAATGKIIDIDPATGAGTVLDEGDVRWFGAGVATDAPIIE
ncbi:MAG: hypothetical protein AB7O24_15420 [Kofleriaceae bacterium]